MNLQHLRYLMAVSRTGSFTRAAASMYVTQPTVSSAIAELETELGVKLFNRNGRRVEFTIEGRTLLNYAVQIQDLVEEASDRLTDVRSDAPIIRSASSNLDVFEIRARRVHPKASKP